MRIDANGWCYSPDHGQLCQTIETQTLWGETTCRVWLPGSNAVVRIPASRLKPLEDAGAGSPDAIAYIAAGVLHDGGNNCSCIPGMGQTFLPQPQKVLTHSRNVGAPRT